METKNTVDFDITLINDFFKGVERQGPGAAASTRRALELIPPIGAGQTILDIGCGSGKQTEVLAAETEAKIIATDISEELLSILAGKLSGYGDRIKTLAASMDSLPLPEESIDTIWAEGSVFIIGLRNGLKQWRRLLKQGGYIVLSDAAWITPERPAEIESYWKANYPEIGTVSECIAVMEQEGYSPIAHFFLPEEGWTTNYYVPMAEQIEKFGAEHRGEAAVEGFLGALREEIATYERYKDYYSYVFFIGRKL